MTEPLTEERLAEIRELNERARIAHVMTRWEDGRCRELRRLESEEQIDSVDAILAEVVRLRAVERDAIFLLQVLSAPSQHDIFVNNLWVSLGLLGTSEEADDRVCVERLKQRLAKLPKPWEEKS